VAESARAGHAESERESAEEFALGSGTSSGEFPATKIQETDSYLSIESLDLELPKEKNRCSKTCSNLAFKKVLVETRRSRLGRVLHFPVNTWDALA